jgi:hypothetical protein
MTKRSNMEFIEREIKDLDEDTQIKFGQLVYSAKPEYVTKCTDGSRIFLNRLPEELIQTLYNFVKNQIDMARKPLITNDMQ